MRNSRHVSRSSRQTRGGTDIKTFFLLDSAEKRPGETLVLVTLGLAKKKKSWMKTAIVCMQKIRVWLNLICGC